MNERIRNIEKYVFRFIILTLSIVFIFGVGVSWLFKTNQGRSFVFKSIISIVNNNSSFNLAYNDLKSDNSGLLITDFHLDLPDSTRVLSLDSLKTGVLLSSVLKNSINIPRLKVYGLRFDQSVNDSLLSQLQQKGPVEKTRFQSNSLIVEYLKNFSISINDIDLNINEFELKRDQKNYVVDHFNLEIEYLQFSNRSTYTVLDNFSAVVYSDKQDYRISSRGIIYSDQRDLEFQGFNLGVDDHKLSFDLEVFDLFSFKTVEDSSSNRIFQIPRLVKLTVNKGSRLDLSKLLPREILPSSSSELAFEAEANLLPRQRIADINKLNFSIDSTEIQSTAYLNNAFDGLKIAPIEKLIASVSAKGIIDKAWLSSLSNRFLQEQSYFSDPLHLHIKSNLNSGLLEQQLEVQIGRDSLSLSHQKIIGNGKNSDSVHNISVQSNSLSVADFSSFEDIPEIKRLKVDLAFDSSGKNAFEKVNQLELAIDEIPAFHLSEVEMRFDGNGLEKSLIGNFNFAKSQISTEGTLSVGKTEHAFRGSIRFQDLSSNQLFHSNRFSDTPLLGELNVYSSLKSPKQASVDNEWLNRLNELTASLQLSTVTIDSVTIPAHRYELAVFQNKGSLNLSLDSPVLKASSNLSHTAQTSGEFVEAIRSTTNHLVAYYQENGIFSTEIENQSVSVQAESTFQLGNPLYLYPWFNNRPPSSWNGNGKLSLNKVKDDLSIKAAFESARIEANTFQWDSLSTSFSYHAVLDSISLSVDDNFQHSLNVKQLTVENLPIKGLQSTLNSTNKDFEFQLRTDEFVQNARFDFDIEGSLNPSKIALKLPYFNFGNEIYGWKNDDVASLFRKQDSTWVLSDFFLSNGSESIEIFGEIGNQVDDVLNYRLNKLDLGKLSELIQGRLPFAGILNGRFALGTNTEKPFFDGELAIDAMKLRGRLMGDLTLESSFDTLASNYRASLELNTDTSKYPNIPVQNIYGSGFFNPKPNALDRDTLAYLDLEFEDVAMWFLPSVAVNVFDSTRGRATGYGNFIATGAGYDYQALLSVDSVYAKPKFINTDYFLSGPIYLTRNEGVIIDTVLVQDTYGDAKFWGIIDLNDFQEQKFMDLSLQLNGLQFMNNIYDPDVPFYGNVQGYGLVQLRGSTLSPTISTADAIRISEGSELKLPLLSETDFEGQKSYIRFTDSFDNLGKTGQDLLLESKKKEQQPGSIFSRTIDDTERNFVDFFNLELLFSAPEETTIELIFDDVTNETLRANGSGDIRVGLSDGVVRINGTYNLTNGRYNFVSGDFFTRVFTLEEGGQIIWDGDPTNAQINVSATYTQRADFSPFFGQSSDQQNATVFRVPVNMVLDLTGRLQRIENDYRFSLPSTMDLSANADLINNIITSINSEQYKLYQATSFLLTNSFLPIEGGTGGLADANRSVIDNIQQNPDALIAPLLSNQINSLLNTNLGTIFQNLEFDINLSTLDQIDLGLALRLFKDRLVIRRNRSIANNPNQNTIGDIDANYKLSDRWSLLVFHRQDPLFSDIGGGGTNQQTANTQALNGVGIEWQQQFSSWKNLWKSIANIWSGLFKGKENQSENESNSSGQNQSLTYTPLVKTNSDEKKEKLEH